MGNWFDTKFGPFCSHRCRLLDLGKWLNEEHSVSRPLQEDDLERLDLAESPNNGVGSDRN